MKNKDLLTGYIIICLVTLLNIEFVAVSLVAHKAVFVN